QQRLNSNDQRISRNFVCYRLRIDGFIQARIFHGGALPRTGYPNGLGSDGTSSILFLIQVRVGAKFCEIVRSAWSSPTVARARSCSSVACSLQWRMQFSLRDFIYDDKRPPGERSHPQKV